MPIKIVPLAIYTQNGYIQSVIKTFADLETEKIFRQEFSRKLPQTIQRVALRKLLMINAAMTLNDLRIPPANHLEALSGDREGQFSIRINGQYRICFVWDGNDAEQVEIVDYH
jgi:proteic killer suppression protein